MIVGIAPRLDATVTQPLAAWRGGSSGGRLAAMAGLTPDEFHETFDRVNLFPWPIHDQAIDRNGRQLGRNLAASLLVGRRVILLGKSVARCFEISGPRVDKVGYCCWRSGRPHHKGVTSGNATTFDWAVLPHPSGLNRWYNEEENRLLAEEFLRHEVEVSRLSV